MAIIRGYPIETIVGSDYADDRIHLATKCATRISAAYPT